MNLQDRLLETEQKFNNLQNQRKEQLTIIENAQTKAKELWDEMMRIQGDYRTLEELDSDEIVKEVIKTNKKATVIDAVPEEK